MQVPEMPMWNMAKSKAGLLLGVISKQQADKMVDEASKHAQKRMH